MEGLGNCMLSIIDCDYRLSIVLIVYSLPLVEETPGMLAGAEIFSKLDAKMGFW